MLKGHTRIELTDVNTGEVIVHEDTNMFTNAIHKTLNNAWTALVGGVSTLKDWHLPLSQKMLGGIALFEDSIEEVETNNHFPKGNKVVGMAGTISSDGATKNWGSRNTLESEVFDPATNSVKHVWDFSTAEANGKISAVGLTDGIQVNHYGQSAWNVQYSRALNVTSYFDAYGKHIAEFKGDTFVAMTNGTGQVTIKKVKFNFDTVSLNNDLGTTEVISEKTVSLPNSGMNYTCTYWFDGDDGYWYGFIHCSNNDFSSPYNNNVNSDYNSSLYLQVIRIHKETYGVEYHNITTPSSVYTFPKVAHPIITDKYIVLPYTTKYQYYEYNSNDTNVKNVVLDKVCCISKTDWTCAVKELKDADENSHSMYTTANIKNVRSFYFGCWSNLKLKNGLYQMQDIIFDDNVVVQEHLKAPVNPSTNVPHVGTSDTTALRSNLNPNAYSSLEAYFTSKSSSLPGVTTFMLPNEEKEIILMNAHFAYANSSFGSGAGTIHHVFAVPYDSQTLMTINNLSSPVTKTASQTMKITYTITDVVEE